MWRILILSLFFISSNSEACGVTKKHFEAYWNKTTIESKQKHLERTNCREVYNYYPHQDDPVIAKVILDAIERKLNDDVIKETLNRYNCAYGARNNDHYKTIKEYIGNDEYLEFCQVSKLKNAYIIDAKGGANMRAQPNSKARKIDSIRYGVLVEQTDKQISTEWVHVRYQNNKGYIHHSLLVRY